MLKMELFGVQYPLLMCKTVMENTSHFKLPLPTQQRCVAQAACRLCSLLSGCRLMQPVMFQETYVYCVRRWLSVNSRCLSDMKCCYHNKCNVNVHAHIPDIPVGSADCTVYTPGNQS